MTVAATHDGTTMTTPDAHDSTSQHQTAASDHRQGAETAPLPSTPRQHATPTAATTTPTAAGTHSRAPTPPDDEADIDGPQRRRPPAPERRHGAPPHLAVPLDGDGEGSGDARRPTPRRCPHDTTAHELGDSRRPPP